MSHLYDYPDSIPLFFTYYFLGLMPLTLIHLFSFSRDPAQDPGDHASEMSRKSYILQPLCSGDDTDIF